MPTTTSPPAPQEQVPLAPLTTLGVGGPARHYLPLRQEAELPAALEWAAERALPVFVLGGGSNLVVSDAGFPGLVLHMRLAGREAVETGDGFAELRVAAGEEWDPLVAFAVERGWAGLECLSGIPGTVGATPVQNVGAYGQEASQTITLVRAWDRREARFVDLSAVECRFRYRRSIFNSSERDRYIITRVDFRLRVGAPEALKYAELRQRFAQGAPATLSEIREAVRQIRRGKGMLVEPDAPESRSAGSFFKNPIIPRAQLERLKACAGAEPPCFPADDEQHVKVAAAWLIERAGFHKGYRPAGPVGISSRHALALVNYGGATASDVLRLKEEIQRRVRERLGIELTPEPILL